MSKILVVAIGLIACVSISHAQTITVLESKNVVNIIAKGIVSNDPAIPVYTVPAGKDILIKSQCFSIVPLNAGLIIEGDVSFPDFAARQGLCIQQLPGAIFKSGETIFLRYHTDFNANAVDAMLTGRLVNP